MPALDKHRQWLSSTGRGQERKLEIIRYAILDTAAERARISIQKNDPLELEKSMKSCLARTLDPHTAADRLLNSVLKGAI